MPEAAPHPPPTPPADLRLFLAVSPPPSLTAQLEALRRPSLDWVRWTTPEQWHITLRFLGRTPSSDVLALVDSLRHAGERPEQSGVQRCRAEAGPAVERLGRQILCVPVAGLVRLVAGVEAATVGFGEPPEQRPYRGHLTIARARGKHRFRATDEGAPMAATWEVTAIEVLQSHLGAGGAHYEPLASVDLL